MPDDSHNRPAIPTSSARRHSGADVAFYSVFAVIGGAYLLLILAMLLADAAYLVQSESSQIDPEWARQHPLLATVLDNTVGAALSDRYIRQSVYLSLVSCSITTILSLWVAVPVGYLLSRRQFFGKDFIEAILDIPIVLPPLVVGLSLLILFQYLPGSLRENVVYQVPAVILSQFVVACAFAVRAMRASFDHIDPRREQVALTLGCSRAQAFGNVVLPETGPGLLTAATLAWARSLGEFGPLLVFAGATRGKTEVLSTSVFLELSIGNLEGAVAVSFIMIFAAITVLMITRRWGSRHLTL